MTPAHDGLSFDDRYNVDAVAMKVQAQKKLFDKL